MSVFPRLGHGIGLRPKHYPDVLAGTARPDWFEVISENFMVRGGRPLAVLERARAVAPVVLHGVSLSLGARAPGTDNLGVIGRDKIRRPIHADASSNNE